MPKFQNILNDTIDYFLLGDMELLKDYKTRKGLSNDLATEFTTNESGDDIVKEGILIPMSKIVNQPYTIIFNTSDHYSEFDDKKNKLSFKKTGYILQVENNKVILFTWRILNDYNDNNVSKLTDDPAKWNRPFIELKNGWYDVEILGGFTEQKSEVKNVKGNMIEVDDFEPTFEFKFTLKDEKSDFTAPLYESFELVDN